MSNGNSDEPCTLSSLPLELITLVAEELDLSGLARLAAASTVCLAAAQGELRAALRTAVQRSLVPGAGPVSEALMVCPYLCIPDGLAIIPIGTFRETSLISITLPATVTTINHHPCLQSVHLPYQDHPPGRTHQSFVRRIQGGQRLPLCIPAKRRGGVSLLSGCVQSPSRGLAFY